MARKRANGEGSYYQLQDRTWVYQVTVGKKADGSPQRKSFKGRTKAICKQRKEEWDIAQATIQERMEQERLEAENVEALAARPGYFPEAETLFANRPPMPAIWQPIRPTLARRSGKCRYMPSRRM